MPFTGNPSIHDVSEFSTGMSGTCLCGSITVKISDCELFTKPRGHLCHCSNCRKVSGTYSAANLIIETEKVEITDMENTSKEYVDKDTGSGNPVHRWFCSRCGNPIRSITTNLPGKVILKLGIFPRIPVPEFENFGAHKHEWQASHDGVINYKINKAYDEFIVKP